MSGGWGNDPIQQAPAAPPPAASWGNDPVVGSARFRFSDDALARAHARPGSTVVNMTPQQYLALTPDMPANPRTDKKGAALNRSLDNGDHVNDVPSLEVVVGKDGQARVTDQDGRHRAQAAIDAGVGSIPVVVQRFGDKAPIKSVLGMRDGATPIPFDFQAASPPVVAKPPPEKPAAPGILEKILDAVYVPKKNRDPTFSGALINGLQDAFPAPQSGAETVARNIPVVGPLITAAHSPEVQRQFEQAAGRTLEDLVPSSSGIGNELLNISGLGGLKTAGDIASMVLAPLTGTLTAAVGRPVEQATGVPREITGNALSALVPLAPEAKAAGAAASVADAAASRGAALSAGAVDAAYAARVARLKAEGIEPTVGQLRGGMVRRFEEGHKSDPLFGGAIREQETNALNTFNRALYNRVLEPLGVKLSPTAPVGRNSVKVVGDMVSNAYDALKPKMRLVPDDETINSLADIRSHVGELPPAQQAQFEAILNNRVLHRLGSTGQMDGTVFKTTESDLSRLARDYKGSPDPAQRGLGHALEDVTATLRANLERSSDPGIRADLQKINKSWSLLTRLEDAASRRAGGDGLVTPMDLLGAIRKGDRTVRHRGFARGDAQLQRLGEDAYSVLGNKLPDSGTAERLMMNGHGLMTHLAGYLTNPVAAHGLNMLRRGGSAAHIPTPQNFILHPELLRRAPVLSLGNLQNLPGQANGQ